MTDIMSPTICPAGRGAFEAPPESHWPSAEGLLKDLLFTSVIRRYDWERLEQSIQESIVDVIDDDLLLNDLVSNHLLTEYQADRIRSGQQFGLILGHYRVLSRTRPGRWLICNIEIS
jgi:hypothetical protein